MTVINSGKGRTQTHVIASNHFATFFIIFTGYTCKHMRIHDFLPVYSFNATKCCNSCYKRICYMVSAIIHGSFKLYFLIKQHPKLNKEHPGTCFRSCTCSLSNPKLELNFYFPHGYLCLDTTNSTVQLLYFLNYSPQQKYLGLE